MPVDDMRPMMHDAYNFSLAHTPHLDHFSHEGLTFTRAYVQYAYCSPSRNSFMTGRRPDTTRVWEFVDHFREKKVGANWTSLPQYFKRHGYLTLGGGKLYHPSSKTENIGMHSNDYPASWSPEFPYYSNRPKEDPYTCANPKVEEEGGTYCIAEVGKDESKLTDQKIRDNCIEHLHLAQNETHREGSVYFGKPFFLGCGFHKPHVPWHVPQEFYDQLPEWEDIPLPPTPLQYAPQGMPSAAWHTAVDVKGVTTGFNGTDTCNVTRTKLYRRAYYAAVGYQDYNIGQVLKTLDALGYTNSTVCIVFGDHGWQLGEHDVWAKMTNFELGTHIPMIVRVPWILASVGQRTSVLAEAVDLYKTLAALAGLPPPSSIGEQVNGTSLLPAFEAPTDRRLTSALKDAAFSQFAKTNGPNNSDWSVANKFHRNETKLMGYTVRVDDWRYTVWFPFDDQHIRPILSTDLGRELYDHRGDSGLWLDGPYENINLVNEQQHSALVQELHQRVLGYIQLH
jgi:arylsulfatase A-like enzyme